MTAPEVEYNYDHLTLKLNINERYSLNFLFYDERMSGSGLHYIYLNDELNNIKNRLRLDSPVDDGRPCFFNGEILAIMNLLLNNPNNNMNPTQILCCLGFIHDFDESLIEEITTKFNVNFDLDSTNIWDNFVVQRSPLVSNLNDQYLEPYKQTLNDMYPVPKIYTKSFVLYDKYI